MKKLIYLVVLVFLVNGCAATFQDIKINNAIQQGRLHFGMTKQEVVKVIGPPMSFDVKTYTDEKGTREDWSYEWGPNWSAIYILHFENGVLKSWGTR